MHQADVHAAYLPGIIILVHGVNSDGEWFEQTERGLCEGLNARLGYDHAYQPEACQLRPVQYLPELLPNGNLNKTISGKTFVTDHGRSPVIRFRWGYKAANSDGTNEDQKAKFKGKIYLNEDDAWGGGPFQNGTSALPYMWGEGLDDRVFWWLYANMFPVDGRDVYASPPRAYFAHAADRLRELIKAIRAKQADCPITVVCHSQGNMVTLAAALLGEKEGHIADTYVLCNPPYSLESLTMDKLVNHDSKSAVGEFGSVSTLDRKTTFRNFLEAVKNRAGQGQPAASINDKQLFKDCATGEIRFQLNPFPANPKQPPQPGQDRDNRGRVFLYCNPHDQVIGVSPVQGIGWKGVSSEQCAELGTAGVFHQRVWAQPGGQQSTPFAVGGPAWTGVSYRYRQDNHDPKQFWHPLPPAMHYSLSLNDRQSFISRIIAIGTAPIVYIVTHLFNLRINDDPPKTWAVPIDAPALPEPVTPRSRRYGETGDFDEGADPAADALAKADDPRKVGGEAYEAGGKGDAASEAALRYEHQARLRMKAAQQEKEQLDPEEQRATLRKMLEENPNATDHSTILTNPEHARKALAYDVAVGWVDYGKITDKDLFEFRKLAHWMVAAEYKLDRTMALECQEYWDQGFRKRKQIHMHYNMAHMKNEAPKILDTERERSLAGYFK